MYYYFVVLLCRRYKVFYNARPTPFRLSTVFWLYFLLSNFFQQKESNIFFNIPYRFELLVCMLDTQALLLLLPLPVAKLNWTYVYRVEIEAAAKTTTTERKLSFQNKRLHSYNRFFISFIFLHISHPSFRSSLSQSFSNWKKVEVEREIREIFQKWGEREKTTWIKKRVKRAGKG